MSFGKPSVGNSSSGGNFKKDFNIKDGDNIYRVMPPFGSLKDKGDGWSVYYRLHWGYGVVGEDGKFSHRPFQCVKRTRRNKETGEIETLVSCAACDFVEEQNETLRLRREELDKTGVTPNEKKTILAPLTDAVKKYNSSGGFRLNVMNQEGEFGRLTIPYKMMQSFRTAREDCINVHNIDPIDLETGCWLNFRRTLPPGGSWRDYSHNVTPVMEMTEIPGLPKPVPMIKQAPLSPQQIEEAVAKCHDLVLEAHRRLTPQQIKMIVDSGGDPEVVESVMSTPDVVEASPSHYSNGVPRTAPTTPSSATVTASVPPTVPNPSHAAPAANAAQQQAVIAELQQQLAALQAQSNPVVSNGVAKTEAPVEQPAIPDPQPESNTIAAFASEDVASEVEKMASLSDEDFLASFGIG